MLYKIFMVGAGIGALTLMLCYFVAMLPDYCFFIGFLLFVIIMSGLFAVELII